MAWEDRPPSLTPHPFAGRLAHRRCTQCRRVAYCPPHEPCRCGGTFSRPPGWPTMLAPRRGRVEAG